jgi:hypothetical protein
MGRDRALPEPIGSGENNERSVGGLKKAILWNSAEAKAKLERKK